MTASRTALRSPDGSAGGLAPASADAAGVVTTATDDPASDLWHRPVRSRALKVRAI